MDSLLVFGIILIVGFLFGEIADKLGLPKVTGYIIGGICLDPQLIPLIPEHFMQNTDLAVNLSLSFITFSVGASLLFSHIRKLGRIILLITLLEAECALFFVAAGFIAVSYILGLDIATSSFATFIVLSILLASLASPTDPSATLAVIHEYHAQGEVSSTIMAVAGFDDVLGIINFSLCTAAARIILSGSGSGLFATLGISIASIFGGIGIGLMFGVVFNVITALSRKESEGSIIVFTFALLALCFGLTRAARCDELLATMTMGCIVVNFNPMQEKILGMLERYTEELIFVLFFTLSGAHLDFSVLSKVYGLAFIFVIFRGAGKFTGAVLGAKIGGATKRFGRYVSLGLIPQGGIVIGLALVIKTDPAFSSVSDIVISVIIGVTIIHELLGPLLAKMSLKKAGEIS